MFSSPCLLTVLAKYPSVQNSPPHNSFFTSRHSLKTPLAIMLFTVVTIFVNEYVETDSTKKWAWSSSVPISKKLIWYLFYISKQIFFITWSTCSSITTLRYFAGNTKWYNNTVTLWLLCMYLLILLFYDASGREYNPKRFNYSLFGRQLE